MPQALRFDVRRVLLYDGGHTFRTEDGIDVWPVNQFLEALKQTSFGLEVVLETNGDGPPLTICGGMFQFRPL